MVPRVGVVHTTRPSISTSPSPVWTARRRRLPRTTTTGNSTMSPPGLTDRTTPGSGISRNCGASPMTGKATGIRAKCLRLSALWLGCACASPRGGSCARSKYRCAASTAASWHAKASGRIISPDGEAIPGMVSGGAGSGVTAAAQQSARNFRTQITTSRYGPICCQSAPDSHWLRRSLTDRLSPSRASPGGT